MMEALIAFGKEYGQMLLMGTAETLYMSLTAVILAYALGLPLGICVFMTGKNGIRPNRWIGWAAEWIVGLGRSIPFLILMVALIPLTRLVMGSAIGPTAAIFPLMIGAAPFVARIAETAFQEVDGGLIETAKAMGATDLQIIFKVLLPEALPALVRGAAVAAITMVGYSALSGTVGGGGLGDIAIRYGYHRYENSVMLATIVLLVGIVQLLQGVCNFAALKLDKRTR
ncbi:methionine ABC transporter permease [Acidaminobacterium chupaoyuni]